MSGTPRDRTLRPIRTSFLSREVAHQCVSCSERWVSGSNRHSREAINGFKPHKHASFATHRYFLIFSRSWTPILLPLGLRLMPTGSSLARLAIDASVGIEPTITRLGGEPRVLLLRGVVRGGGFEPTRFRVSDGCSTGLSYPREPVAGLEPTKPDYETGGGPSAPTRWSVSSPSATKAART